MTQDSVVTIYQGVRNKTPLVEPPPSRIGEFCKNNKTPLTELRRRRKILKPPLGELAKLEDFRLSAREARENFWAFLP